MNNISSIKINDVVEIDCIPGIFGKWEAKWYGIVIRIKENDIYVKTLSYTTKGRPVEYNIGINDIYKKISIKELPDIWKEFIVKWKLDQL